VFTKDELEALSVANDKVNVFVLSGDKVEVVLLANDELGTVVLGDGEVDVVSNGKYHDKVIFSANLRCEGQIRMNLDMQLTRD